MFVICSLRNCEGERLHIFWRNWLNSLGAENPVWWFTILLYTTLWETTVPKPWKKNARINIARPKSHNFFYF